jgi:predicted nuclease of restriction endonuclease-like (RecB) superfamily
MPTEKNSIIPQNTDAKLDISQLFKQVSEIIAEARKGAYRAVNFAMVQAYWQIGESIVNYELKGKERADYGEKTLDELARKLTADFGKGFTTTNLRYMKLFYGQFPIRHALRDELSWTHYRLLLKVKDESARQFYEVESVNSHWSSRELERQIDSLLFERLKLSRDKDTVLALSNKGQVIQSAKDLIKNPYIFEFLDIADKNNYLEKDLEQSLIDKLQNFLLELGKGFAFVGRQKRITIDNNHYYIDLVFYNYILKCFVLIDLKTGKLTPENVGKMDFYVRYYEKEERQTDDRATIGLVLCSDKNESIARYTILEESKQIFASEYKLYLPSEEDWTRELAAEREQLEVEKGLEEK